MQRNVFMPGLGEWSQECARFWPICPIFAGGPQRLFLHGLSVDEMSLRTYYALLPDGVLIRWQEGHCDCGDPDHSIFRPAEEL